MLVVGDKQNHAFFHVISAVFRDTLMLARSIRYIHKYITGYIEIDTNARAVHLLLGQISAKDLEHARSQCHPRCHSPPPSLMEAMGSIIDAGWNL